MLAQEVGILRIGREVSESIAQDDGVFVRAILLLELEICVDRE